MEREHRDLCLWDQGCMCVGYHAAWVEGLMCIRAVWGLTGFGIRRTELLIALLGQRQGSGSSYQVGGERRELQESV